jgi:hypothetical protein
MTRVTDRAGMQNGRNFCEFSHGIILSSSEKKNCLVLQGGEEPGTEARIEVPFILVP